MRLLVCSIYLFGCSFLCAQGPWELKKDKNGIQVFIRTVPDSKIHEFKALMKVEAEMDALIAMVQDGDNLKNWNYKTSESATVKLLSKTERIIWMKNDLPWPIRNRDHVTHMTLQRISSTETRIYIQPDTSNAVPPKDDAVRIVNFRGVWTFKQLENSVEVSYQLFGDPNGKLPSWLLNSLLTKAPYSSFKNLRERIQSSASLFNR